MRRRWATVSTTAATITIGNAGDYIEKLRACHVIVHFSERCAIIRDGAKAAAEAAGLVTLVEDEGLVAENAGLTEWPVPMLGRFDPAFLEVPQEVIQLTARVNQKYFVCHEILPANGEGDQRSAVEGHPQRLSRPRKAQKNLHRAPPPFCGWSPSPVPGRNGFANAFVCTANIVRANDGGAAIVAGNENRYSRRYFVGCEILLGAGPDLIPRSKSSSKKIVLQAKAYLVTEKLVLRSLTSRSMGSSPKLARWLSEENQISPLRFANQYKPVGGDVELYLRSQIL